MKRLFTSTLLTVAAIPFLMAAPHAAKKAQNSTTPAAPAAQTKTAKKASKKQHVKKSQNKAVAQTPAAAPSQK